MQDRAVPDCCKCTPEVHCILHVDACWSSCGFREACRGDDKVYQSQQVGSAVEFQATGRHA